VEQVAELARADGHEAVLISFEPHPREVLADLGRPPVARLTLEEEKLELLAACALDRVVLLDFTPELARWEAERFLRDGLLRHFAMRRLVVGDNHAFGQGRGGDLDLLRRLSRELGYALDVVEPVLVDGERISSTRIRHELQAGRVEAAARLLGRPFRFQGRVVPGMGRGRGLGIPTANLEVSSRQMMPRDGVYAVAARLMDGRRLPGMMNLGPRPTFGENARQPEIHLFDFAESLYEQVLKVDILGFVRDTMRFNSGEQLAAQLQKDRHRIQDRLATQEGGG
jgi:riboflavin kinase/FMN adenylyltransferase